MPLNISKNSVISPQLSIIIPTLNSEKVLEKCLLSIKKQIFKSYEIIICDASSSDNTLKIAKKFHCQIINNPLKSAEAAKAIGLKYSRGKYIALIDSDNILPTKNWFTKMLIPFNDPKIIGSEPISFTYRKNAGYIERYSSLLGANDPYAYISGKYDRYSQLSQKWTNIKLFSIDNQEYLKIKIDDNRYIPTIGANGTIFRKKFIQNVFNNDYLFDIDILAIAPKPLYFAKVKIGIIHSFCESSLKKFIKKQTRRLTDYYIYQTKRHYQWVSQNNQYKFTFYSLLIFPALLDALRGYIKKPDTSWFFHPLACYITWWIYFLVTIKYKFGFLKSINRQQWQQ